MTIDLEAIKARIGAATAGPWEAKAYRVFVGPADSSVPHGRPGLLAACWRQWGSVPSIMADAEFIAQARTDVPALVAEVERLRTALWRAPEDWLKGDDEAWFALTGERRP